MHLQVHGKQVDVGDALRRHTSEKVATAVGKYFDGSANGIVTYARENHAFKCDCLVHLSSGIALQAEGSGDDARTALDRALERIGKQLRRYKGRLKAHHSRGQPVESVVAQSYVIEDVSDDSVEEPESLEPVVIAEMTTELKSLTVGEAVMQMHLSDVAALMFRNRGTGRFNVVYRRHDGHIGWIDPPAEAGRRAG